MSQKPSMESFPKKGGQYPLRCCWEELSSLGYLLLSFHKSQIIQYPLGTLWPPKIPPMCLCSSRHLFRLLMLCCNCLSCLSLPFFPVPHHKAVIKPWGGRNQCLSYSYLHPQFLAQYLVHSRLLEGFVRSGAQHCRKILKRGPRKKNAMQIGWNTMIIGMLIVWC